MQSSPTVLGRPVVEMQIPPMEVAGKNEAYSGGISWPAVIGGAFVSAALSLILLALGTGLGFSSISPWANLAATASTIGRAAIIWLVATQIIACAMGGYLAGRLRTKWVNVHTDEVYFRDTAHGFLVWALGLVVTAAFLASAVTSIAGGAVQRAPGGEANATPVLNPNTYMVDVLFRSNGAVTERSDALAREEAERLFSHAMREGNLSTTDRNYLAQIIAARTGLSQGDAEARVSDVFAQVQQSADTARKAFAHLSLWLFVALLSGAFCASYAGTIGGRQRDRVIS
jgi:hypothetical protein